MLLAQAKLKPGKNRPSNQRQLENEYRAKPGEFDLLAWVLPAALKTAAYLGRAGWVKQYGTPYFLLIDRDSVQCPSLGRIWRVARSVGLRVSWVRLDRTERGWHVLVRHNRKLGRAEIVALQAILGSDPARECFNMARILSGRAVRSKRWNLLFERKLPR